MKAHSITRRLILTLTAGAVILWVLATLFAIVVLRNEQQQALDGGLRETAERILPLAIDALVDDADGDRDGAVDYQPPLDSGEHSEQVVYQVRQPDGRILMRSFNAPAEPFDAPLAEGFSTHSPWRLYTMSDRESGLFIQIAESEQRREATLFGSALAMLVPLVLLVPLGALGIALAVRSGLAPLRRVGDEIARRGAGNLAPLEIGDTPAELTPMTVAIDGLLGRLRAAFEAERALAANSAHELRTPIAGSLAQTQRLVEELDGLPAQERARRVEDSLHRLSALAAKLLALSRAESGTARTSGAIDLIPALRLIVEDANATGNVVLNVAAPLEAAIDLDAFGIVMRNLIENALLHGSATEPVAVTVGDGQQIEVTNAGPVVPADRLAQLTRRFARGDTAAPGSGLGLTIVDTIMRQVGGRLELQSPGVDRSDGFTARLIFSADG